MSRTGDEWERLRGDPYNEDAWFRLYPRLRRHVAGLLFRHGMRNRAEVDDITQEVFRRFLERSPWKWSQLPDLPVVFAYLRTIARHVLIDEQRREKRMPREQQDVDFDSFEAPVALVEPPPDLLARLGQRLTPEEQLLLKLILGGISLRDIGLVLNCSPGAAGVRVHRLKKRLAGLAAEVRNGE